VSSTKEKIKQAEKLWGLTKVWFFIEFKRHLWCLVTLNPTLNIRCNPTYVSYVLTRPHILVITLAQLEGTNILYMRFHIWCIF
jgi:hypothetical protein